MKVTDFTRRVLAFRRQAKSLQDRGYHRIEADWRLQRGGLYDAKYKIEDVVISEDGKYIYYKLNEACDDHDKEMAAMKAEREQNE